jgi:polysaccharide export outer membrane protein
MRACWLPVVLLATLALAGCMRAHPYPVIKPIPQQPPQVLQYSAGPVQPAVPPHGPAVIVPAQAGPYVAEPPYTLDSGDRLRVVVFGQTGLTSTYAVDASGHISMPLIGSVEARGKTPQELAQQITASLRRGYMRDPHVTAEVVTYRPFFILGEVTTPGQYPYVAHMTVETAVAIAGGYGPRASKGEVTVSRVIHGQTVKFGAPVTYPVQPGDTIRIKERWF